MKRPISIIITLLLGVEAFSQCLTPPVAILASNTDTICTGEEFGYAYNNTANSGCSYYFDWGDGGADTTTLSSGMQHTYTTGGIMTVRLIVEDTSNPGCLDTAYRTLVVIQAPTAAYSINPTTPCLGTTNALTDLTITDGGPAINNWLWIINERDSLNTQNLNYQFLYAGTQYITLEATNAGGCSSTVTDTIIIENDTALTNFSWPASNCPCNEIPFTGSGTAVSYSWNFGDGSTATGSSATHTFSTPGLYSVALTGTSVTGCKYTRKKQINVCPNDTVRNTSLSDYNWVFGRNNALSFSSSPPMPFPGTLNTKIEIAAAISNPITGNLMFYTSGDDIWSANNVIMPNGSGLNGGGSSAQGSLIVPMPGTPTKYYVIVSRGRTNGLSQPFELRYSLVDMTLNGFLGDVVVASKNTVIATHQGYEGLGGIRRSGSSCSTYDEYWITIVNNYQLELYLVSDTGINLFSTTSFQSPALKSDIGAGASAGTRYIMFSKSGGKVAISHKGVNAVFVLDFDRANGVFSNIKKIRHDGNVYGVEFSPDENLLYVSSVGGNPAIFSQYDLNSADIKASEFVIDSLQYSGLQTAIDGKIYVAVGGNSRKNIAAINNPNIKGVGCNYTDTVPGLLMANDVYHALQNILELDFQLMDTTLTANFTIDTSNCNIAFTNASITEIHTDPCSFLYNVDTLNYLWDFGDGNTSNLQNPTHTYTGAGPYTIKLIVNRPYMCLADSFSITATVPICSLYVSPDTSICLGDSTLLTAGGSLIGYTWADSSTFTPVLSTDSFYMATPLTTTTYGVYNATDTLYVTVTVILPTVSAGNDTTVMPFAAFSLSGSGGTSYLWSPSSGLSCTQCQYPTVSVSSDATYCVTGTDSNGCVNTDCIDIIIDVSGEVWAANIFSPNGDGLNDVFYIRGLIQDDQFLLIIYNRWGELVFETYDPKMGWDGTHNGKSLNPAVFAFVTSGISQKGNEFELKGNLTLLSK